MRIKKTSQYIEGGANISNVYGTSQSDGYSQEYINRLETYSSSEQRIGTWIDGLPLYRKIISDVVPTTSANGTDVTAGIFVADNIKESIIEWAYIQVGDVDIRRRQIPFITTSGYRISVTSNTSSAGTGYNPPNYVGVSNNYTSYNGKTIVLSVLYTKTTD